MLCVPHDAERVIRHDGLDQGPVKGSWAIMKWGEICGG